VKRPRSGGGGRTGAFSWKKVGEKNRSDLREGGGLKGEKRGAPPEDDGKQKLIAKIRGSKGGVKKEQPAVQRKRPEGGVAKS